MTDRAGNVIQSRMKHEILYQPDNTAIKFILNKGEAVRAESDAMVCMSDGMEFKTNFGAGKNSGGILKNLMRNFLTGDSFFTNLFTASDDGQEVILAPSLEGDIDLIETSSEALVVQARSYLASSPDLTLNTKWQGMKSFFSGESMFMIEASGTGFVVVAAFGGVFKVAVNGGYTVDTGHIVAFSSTLNYKVSKASSGWIKSFMSGEGFVCEFSGKGDVYVQSRNPQEYGRFVGPKLKPIVKNG